MTINYTTLLGLAKPVTGTESGAWGDVVNDQITSLVEDAIANAASISVTAGNVTLTDNNGTSDQARMAILLVTGSPGVSRNIVAPSTSKWYIVKNGSNAEVVLKGSATTGVTIPAGAEVLAFWNGSDFEVTSMVGPSTSTDNAVARFDGTTGKVVQNSSVVIDDSNNITGIVDETLSGNLNFTGTAKRITGDFSNATASNLLLFQTSTSNGTTSVGAIPNGTGNLANFFVVNNSNPANSGAGGIGIDATQVFVTSSIFGSGTYLPMTFFTGGSERMRITIGGLVGIGTISPQALLHASTTADEVARFESTGSPYISLYDTNVRELFIQASSQINIYGETNKPMVFSTNATERMRIAAAGNVGIGTSDPGNARLNVASSGTTSGTHAIYAQNSSATILFECRSDGAFSTGRAAVSPYNLTTGNAANVFIDSLGFLYRSTSSLKYKTDIRDAIHGLAEILTLRPVTYKSNRTDAAGRLSDVVHAGFIAEEVHAAGLTEFVEYDKNESPDALAYGNMVALCVKAIQEQQAIIESLTARIAALESKGA